MHFDSNELFQFTPEYLSSLSHDNLVSIIGRLCKDLSEACDKLNQNPWNSSRPPSSRAPWDRSINKDKSHSADGTPSKADQADLDNQDDSDSQDDSDNQEKQSQPPKDKKPNTQNKPKKKPGKQPGAQGYGRIQTLTVTQVVTHRPTCCKGCECELKEDLSFKPTGGHYTIDIKLPEPGQVGIQGEYVKHVYGSIRCSCGFDNVTKPERLPSELGWIVEMGECRLIGPCLLAFLAFLKIRMHMTISKIRELLATWLGIFLSDGCISTALREAGRALSSLEPQLKEVLIRSKLIYMDETVWKEHKVTRWLWVTVGDDVVYYNVGPRSLETAQAILKDFKGVLMTDGYCAYRSFGNRVRCWAHLERKAKALEQSWNTAAACFGSYAAKAFESLRQSVYKIREETSPAEKEQELERCDEERLRLLYECVRMIDADYEKTREFATEVLMDYPAVFRVLKDAELPLTNNRAELFLRNLVILRNMCHGSKTEEGSRTVAILASVVDTLRLRKADVWAFITEVIGLRRSGKPAPPLPLAPPVLAS